MNFNTTFKSGRADRFHVRILLKLKLTLILLTAVVLQAGATGYAQISINKKSASLESVLSSIRKQSGYDFFYSDAMLKNTKPVSLDVQNASVIEVLNMVLKDQALSYTLDNNTIVLRYKHESSSQQQLNVSGRVLDADNKPIPGATVRVKELAKSPIAITDANGVFTIRANEDQSLLISFIGFETQTISLKGKKIPLIVKLKESETTIKNVVITGTGINRKKDSFTGTTATFSGEELKTLGNNNVLQSLRTVDPSFLIIENNLQGSNPNEMPVIEVRGKSSIPSATLRDQFGNDPNQPLFILDGFPTSLQTVVDLDMNRVASVTILKDAASTALYGSQASNGVVVIETIKPKPGELRFSYTQDFRLELPDLSAYNMMNAAEKLEFERLSGRYNGFESNPTQVVYLQDLYASHLAAVKKGVDTYWLNEPLRNGYSTNSSINASGGDAAFLYNVGMNYRLGGGAMKGDGRDSYSGSINLTYRKGKLNLNNITYIRGNKTLSSPYGNFANYVNANPYFVKNYTDRYLEESRTTQGSTFYITNPLYDATLTQYDKGSSFEIQNNLNANYDLTKDLRLNGGLQISKGSTINQQYRSPEMSAFINTPALRKGTYNDSRTNTFSYQANVMLTYHRVLASKHIINANWRNSISNNETQRYSTAAEGFPEGSTGNPKFAYSYVENGNPNASMGIYRALNTTFSLNYSFDNRFLFDAVYRLDGSTAYGRNNQFTPYYSVGLGWNLHNENWVKASNWINILRLTSNIGITGNQNFAGISSYSIYAFNSNSNYNAFGQGVSLNTLGNPNLEAQKTRQWSSALEFTLFKNRFTGYFNYYNKTTNPLIVPIDLSSSTGVFSYPYNVGALTYNGGEFRLTYFPIYKPEKRVTWSLGLTGHSYRSKYSKIGNSLAALNKQQENNKTLLRYQDGNSAEAIWAIKSLGIDPATGREVFLTKDGQYTFDYNVANIVNVGNSVPLSEGVISSNLRYKNFTFGLAFRYRIGGDNFNTALFNKVENISYTGIAYNQDKRALYERWQKPGDIAQFKGISQTSTTPISSRFVQKENTISSESLSLGYIVEGKDWLKNMGLRTLNINLYGNDYLYLSTIKRERGINYPFARTIAVSLKAGF